LGDWVLGSDNKTLVYQGSGGAPLLDSGTQKSLRSQLQSAPQTSAPASIPLQSGNQQAANKAGGTSNITTGGIKPSGASAADFPKSPGQPGAPDLFGGESDILPGAKVIPSPGGRTVLNPNGVSFFIPDSMGGEEGGGGEGGGGGGGGGATKVNGPQKAEDLLPAFSPPAINQLPMFYNPGMYKPVEGSTGAQGYTGKTAPDLTGQASIANLLGVPWYANELVPKQGKSGYGMPQGGDLNNNYVDPRVYGYISPILNPAMYQGARSSSK
jgi:hypothetical protein